MAITVTKMNSSLINELHVAATAASPQLSVVLYWEHFRFDTFDKSDEYRTKWHFTSPQFCKLLHVLFILLSWSINILCNFFDTYTQ